MVRKYQLVAFRTSRTHLFRVFFILPNSKRIYKKFGLELTPNYGTIQGESHLDTEHQIMI